MHRSEQHETAQHIGHQARRNARPRATFYKKTLIVISYATACAIVAFAMAYRPASAGDTLTNVLPAHMISVPEASTRIYKVDRLSSVSFEERWSAVPTPSAVSGGDMNRREAPRAERRERIPFSCELAFSRLVTNGNFSTRCIAGLETSQINA